MKACFLISFLSTFQRTQPLFLKQWMKEAEDNGDDAEDDVRK